MLFKLYFVLFLIDIYIDICLYVTLKKAIVFIENTQIYLFLFPQKVIVLDEAFQKF